MKRLIIGLALSMTFFTSHAQSTVLRLREAVKTLESDAQLKHGMVGLFIVNAATGETICENNSQTGMAPASCQKVITSAAAFELLGHDYRYQTQLGYDGTIEGSVLKGNLHISGNGDPTLGSWRWKHTREEELMQHWISGIKEAGIERVEGAVLGNDKKWGTATIPDGWIWQDIGNYYGAGASSLNWRENQYDLILKPGLRIGDTVGILSTKPELYPVQLICEVRTAARGSGDNAYIFLPPYASFGFIRGTIPIGEPSFTISGSFPNSALQLRFSFTGALRKAGIVAGDVEAEPVSQKPRAVMRPMIPLYVHSSPPLDSINFWFIRKSINLYGEALIKTIAYEKTGFGATEKGIEVVKYFWSQRGIERSAIRIIDGSGLSPQNRVTPASLVKVLQYAKSRTWFPSFYQALPEINDIRMKSGTIGGAKSYTGYLKSRDGNEYIFALLVNNFEGSSNAIQQKMWRLLDVMK